MEEVYDNQSKYIFGGVQELIKYQEVEKDKIKKYWETRLPQTWYSSKKVGSLGWFNALEYERYRTYYEYIPRVAEFDNHFGEDVLEIGVGVGTDIVQYAKGGAVVSGIDLTESAVEMTRENLRIRGLGYTSLQVGDAEHLDFDDKSFDLVYCFGVLHHTPRPDHAIAEIHRVLKDGGKAIIMLYARGWKHYFKRILIHGILLGKWLKYGYNKLVSLQTEVHGASPLTYVYTKKEIERLFSSFGEVSITRYRLGEYFDYAPYHTKKVPLAVKNVMDLLAMGRLVGENYIIKAVKTPECSRHSFWRTLLAP